MLRKMTKLTLCIALVLTMLVATAVGAMAADPQDPHEFDHVDVKGSEIYAQFGGSNLYIRENEEFPETTYAISVGSSLSNNGTATQYSTTSTYYVANVTVSGKYVKTYTYERLGSFVVRPPKAQLTFSETEDSDGPLSAAITVGGKTVQKEVTAFGATVVKEETTQIEENATATIVVKPVSANNAISSIIVTSAESVDGLPSFPKDYTYDTDTLSYTCKFTVDAAAGSYSIKVATAAANATFANGTAAEDNVTVEVGNTSVAAGESTTARVVDQAVTITATAPADRVVSKISVTGTVGEGKENPSKEFTEADTAYSLSIASTNNGGPLLSEGEYTVLVETKSAFANIKSNASNADVMLGTTVVDGTDGKDVDPTGDVVLTIAPTTGYYVTAISAKNAAGASVSLVDSEGNAIPASYTLDENALNKTVKILNTNLTYEDQITITVTTAPYYVTIARDAQTDPNSVKSISVNGTNIFVKAEDGTVTEGSAFLQTGTYAVSVVPEDGFSLDTIDILLDDVKKTINNGDSYNFSVKGGKYSIYAAPQNLEAALMKHDDSGEAILTVGETILGTATVPVGQIATINVEPVENYKVTKVEVFDADKTTLLDTLYGNAEGETGTTEAFDRTYTPSEQKNYYIKATTEYLKHRISASGLSAGGDKTSVMLQTEGGTYFLKENDLLIEGIALDTDFTVTVTPSDNTKAVASVTVDGTPVNGTPDPSGAYTFTLNTDATTPHDYKIAATFTGKHTVTNSSSDTNATMTVNGTALANGSSVMFVPGAKIEVVVKPAAGKVITSVSLNGEPCTDGSPNAEDTDFIFTIDTTNATTPQNYSISFETADSAIKFYEDSGSVLQPLSINVNGTTLSFVNSLWGGAANGNVGTPASIVITPDNADNYRISRVRIKADDTVKLDIPYTELGTYSFTYTPDTPDASYHVLAEATYRYATFKEADADNNHAAVTVNGNTPDVAVLPGTDAKIIVDPDDNFRLVSVSLDGGTTNLLDGTNHDTLTPFEFTVTDHAEAQTYTITVVTATTQATFQETAESANVAVDVDGDSVAFGDPNDTAVTAAKEVTVTATPEKGYRVTKLEISDGTGTNPYSPTSYPLSGEVSCKVPASEGVTYTVTAVAEASDVTFDTNAENATITVPTGTKYLGDEATISVAANEHYILTSVWVNDMNKLIDDSDNWSDTFTLDQKFYEIEAYATYRHATFAGSNAYYTIDITDADAEKAGCQSDSTVDVAVEITPANGLRVTGITIRCETDDGPVPVYTVPDEDIKLDAFEFVIPHDKVNYNKLYSIYATTTNANASFMLDGNSSDYATVSLNGTEVRENSTVEKSAHADVVITAAPTVETHVVTGITLYDDTTAVEGTYADGTLTIKADNLEEGKTYTIKVETKSVFATIKTAEDYSSMATIKLKGTDPVTDPDKDITTNGVNTHADADAVLTVEAKGGYRLQNVSVLDSENNTLDVSVVPSESGSLTVTISKDDLAYGTQYRVVVETEYIYATLKTENHDKDNAKVYLGSNTDEITTGTYAVYDAPITITAVPETGYVIEEIKFEGADDDFFDNQVFSKTDATYSLTLAADLTAGNEYAITVTTIPAYATIKLGSESSDKVSVMMGTAALTTTGTQIGVMDDIVLTLDPNTGYRVTEVLVNNEPYSVGTNNTVTIEADALDYNTEYIVNVSAEYYLTDVETKADTATVTIGGQGPDENGKWALDPESANQEGNHVIAVTPAKNYELTEIEVLLNGVPAATITGDNLNKDGHRFEFKFEANGEGNLYTINVKTKNTVAALKKADGSSDAAVIKVGDTTLDGTANGIASVNTGEDVTINITTPDPDNEIRKVEILNGSNVTELYNIENDGAFSGSVTFMPEEQAEYTVKVTTKYTKHTVVGANTNATYYMGSEEFTNKNGIAPESTVTVTVKPTENNVAVTKVTVNGTEITNGTIGSNGEYTFSFETAKTAPVTYTITPTLTAYPKVTVNGDGNATVTVNGEALAGSTYVLPGSEVNVKVAADTLYKLTSVALDGNTKDAEFSFTADPRDTAYVISYATTYYRHKVEVSGLTGESTMTVKQGDNIVTELDQIALGSELSVTITKPADNRAVTGASVNGAAVEGTMVNGNFTFTLKTASETATIYTIIPTFTPYRTVTVDGNGTATVMVSADGANYVAPGELSFMPGFTIYVKVTANDKRALSAVTLDDAAVDGFAAGCEEYSFTIDTSKSDAQSYKVGYKTNYNRHIVEAKSLTGNAKVMFGTTELTATSNSVSDIELNKTLEVTITKPADYQAVVGVTVTAANDEEVILSNGKITDEGNYTFSFTTSGNPTTYTITPSYLDYHTLNVTGDGYATVTPENGTRLVPGLPVTVKVVPTGDYALKSVKLGGDDKDAEFTFTTATDTVTTYEVSYETYYALHTVNALDTAKANYTINNVPLSGDSINGIALGTELTVKIAANDDNKAITAVKVGEQTFTGDMDPNGDYTVIFKTSEHAPEIYTITPTFVDYHTITVEGENASANVANGKRVLPGDTVTVTVTPNEKHVLTALTLNGESKLSGTSATAVSFEITTPVNETKEYKVAFSAQSTKVTFTPNIELNLDALSKLAGTITVDKTTFGFANLQLTLSATGYVGQESTISIAPNKNYRVTSIIVLKNGSAVHSESFDKTGTCETRYTPDTPGATYKIDFTVASVNATFKEGSASADASITVNDGNVEYDVATQTVTHGEKATIVVTPTKEDYRLTSVTLNGEELITDAYDGGALTYVVDKVVSPNEYVINVAETIYGKAIFKAGTISEATVTVNDSEFGENGVHAEINAASTIKVVPTADWRVTSVTVKADGEVVETFNNEAKGDYTVAFTPTVYDETYTIDVATKYTKATIAKGDDDRNHENNYAAITLKQGETTYAINDEVKLDPGTYDVTVAPVGNFEIVKVWVDDTEITLPENYDGSEYTFSHTFATEDTKYEIFVLTKNTVATIAKSSESNGHAKIEVDAIEVINPVTVNVGKEVTITVTPDKDYHVTEIAVNGDNKYTMTIEDAIQNNAGAYSFTYTPTAQTNYAVKVITAYALHTVESDAAITGDVTLGGETTSQNGIALGSKLNLTVAPTKENEAVTAVKVNDAVVEGTLNADGTYSFIIETNEKNPTVYTIVPTYTDYHTVTVAEGVDGNATVSPASGTRFLPGSKITVTVKPNADFAIAGVTVNGDACTDTDEGENFVFTIDTPADSSNEYVVAYTTSGTQVTFAEGALNAEVSIKANNQEVRAEIDLVVYKIPAKSPTFSFGEPVTLSISPATDFLDRRVERVTINGEPLDMTGYSTGTFTTTYTPNTPGATYVIEVTTGSSKVTYAESSTNADDISIAVNQKPVDLSSETPTVEGTVSTPAQITITPASDDYRITTITVGGQEIELSSSYVSGAYEFTFTPAEATTYEIAAKAVYTKATVVESKNSSGFAAIVIDGTELDWNTDTKAVLTPGKYDVVVTPNEYYKLKSVKINDGTELLPSDHDGSAYTIADFAFDQEATTYTVLVETANTMAAIALDKDSDKNATVTVGELTLSDSVSAPVQTGAEATIVVTPADDHKITEITVNGVQKYTKTIEEALKTSGSVEVKYVPTTETDHLVNVTTTYTKHIVEISNLAEGGESAFAMVNGVKLSGETTTADDIALGSDIEVTISPDTATENSVASVTVNGAAVSGKANADGSYSFTIKSDAAIPTTYTIVPTFGAKHKVYNDVRKVPLTPDNATVAISADNNTFVTIEPGYSSYDVKPVDFPLSATMYVKVTPAAGKEVSSVTIGGQSYEDDKAGDLDFTFSFPTASAGQEYHISYTTIDSTAKFALGSNPENATVTVNGTKLSYVPYVGGIIGGIIDGVTVEVSADIGVEASIEVTPDANYTVSAIKVDGVEQKLPDDYAGGACTITYMPLEKGKTYEIEVVTAFTKAIVAEGKSSSAYASITVNNTTLEYADRNPVTATVEPGEHVVTIAPEKNYKLTSVQVNGGAELLPSDFAGESFSFTYDFAQAGTTYEIVVATDNLTAMLVRAEDSDENATITVGETTLEGETMFSVATGETAEIKVTPDTGYRITEILVGEDNVLYSKSFGEANYDPVTVEFRPDAEEIYPVKATAAYSMHTIKVTNLSSDLANIGATVKINGSTTLNVLNTTAKDIALGSSVTVQIIPGSTSTKSAVGATVNGTAVENGTANDDGSFSFTLETDANSPMEYTISPVFDDVKHVVNVDTSTLLSNSATISVSSDGVSYSEFELSSLQKQFALGSTIYVKVAPKSGKEITSVTVSGQAYADDNADDEVYTFSFKTPDDAAQTYTIAVESANTKHTVTLDYTNMLSSGATVAVSADGVDYTELSLGLSGINVSKQFELGSKVYVKVTPNTGKEVISVSVNGQAYEDDNAEDEVFTFSFDTDPTASKTYSIAANTENTKHTVSVGLDALSSGAVVAVSTNGEDFSDLSLLSNKQVDLGSKVYVKVTPNAGKEVTSVTVSGQAYEDENAEDEVFTFSFDTDPTTPTTYSIAVDTENTKHTVTLDYSSMLASGATVAVSADGVDYTELSVGLSGINVSKQFDLGSKVYVKVTPNAGKEVTSVTVSGQAYEDENAEDEVFTFSFDTDPTSPKTYSIAVDTENTKHTVTLDYSSMLASGATVAVSADGVDYTELSVGLSGINVSKQFDLGSKVYVKVTPNAGKEVISVTVSGQAYEDENAEDEVFTFSFDTDPTSPKTYSIAANTENTKHTVRLNPTSLLSGVTVAVSDDGESYSALSITGTAFDLGSTVHVKITPNAGKEITSVKVGDQAYTDEIAGDEFFTFSFDTDATAVKSYTITVDTDNTQHTVYTSAVISGVKVSISTDGQNYTELPVTGKSVELGSTVYVKIEANDGKEISSVSVTDGLSTNTVYKENNLSGTSYTFSFDTDASVGKRYAILVGTAATQHTVYTSAVLSGVKVSISTDDQSYAELPVTGKSVALGSTVHVKIEADNSKVLSSVKVTDSLLGGNTVYSKDDLSGTSFSFTFDTDAASGKRYYIQVDADSTMHTIMTTSLTGASVKVNGTEITLTSPTYAELGSTVSVEIIPLPGATISSISVLDLRGNTLYSGTDAEFTFDTSDSSNTYIINVLAQMSYDENVKVVLKENQSIDYRVNLTAKDIQALVFDHVEDASGNVIEVTEDQLHTTITSSLLLGMNAGRHSATVIYGGNGDEYGASSSSVAFTINRADADVNVVSKTILLGENPGNLITVVPTDPANKDDNVDYITIIANTEFDPSALNVKNTVRINLPPYLGNLISGTVTIPVSQVAGYLNDILAIAGLDPSIATAIDSVLSRLESYGLLDAEAQISMGEDITPTEAGTYMIAAIAADANYNSDLGFGTLIILPIEASGEHRFYSSALLSGVKVQVSSDGVNYADLPLLGQAFPLGSTIHVKIEANANRELQAVRVTDGLSTGMAYEQDNLSGTSFSFSFDTDRASGKQYAMLIETRNPQHTLYSAATLSGVTVSASKDGVSFTTLPLTGSKFDVDSTVYVKVDAPAGALLSSVRVTDGLIGGTTVYEQNGLTGTSFTFSFKTAKDDVKRYYVFAEAVSTAHVISTTNIIGATVTANGTVITPTTPLTAELNSTVNVVVTPDPNMMIQSISVMDFQGNVLYSGTDTQFAFATSDTPNTYVINALAVPVVEDGTPIVQAFIREEFKDAHIPQSLKDAGYTTVASIERALKTQITKMDANIAGTVLYDVELMYSEDGGKTWIKADKEHFPANGKLTVLLPIPEGTDPNTHNYIVKHMFTMDAFGHKPGEIETPAVSIVYDGNEQAWISVDLTGLSPVMIGWSLKSVQLPQTGDTSSMLLWIALLGVSATMLVILRKRKANV